MIPGCLWPNTIHRCLLFSNCSWLVYTRSYYRFLHNPNSIEYKTFKQLIAKIRSEGNDKKLEVKPEDKYEPEFSLEDDNSNDSKPHFKDESKDR